MKVKWGALVVDGRNKIGGQVASKNRAGAYLRNKVTPVNPANAKQTNVRNRLTTLSQNWRGLTAAQRAAWNSAVSNFAKTDIFGDLKNPSGFNLYVKLNANLMVLSEDPKTTPPALTSLDKYSGMGMTYASGTPALTLTGDVTAGGDSGYKLYATPPLSQGVNFVSSEYRLIKSAGTIPTLPLNVLTDYNAVFGSVGAVGTKIFLKIIPVGVGSGLEGTATEVSQIAAA